MTDISKVCYTPRHLLDLCLCAQNAFELFYMVLQQSYRSF